MGRSKEKPSSVNMFQVRAVFRRDGAEAEISEGRGFFQGSRAPPWGWHLSRAGNLHEGEASRGSAGKGIPRGWNCQGQGWEGGCLMGWRSPRGQGRGAGQGLWDLVGCREGYLCNQTGARARPVLSA